MVVNKTYDVDDAETELLTFDNCLTASDVANLIQPNGTIDDGGTTVPCHGMWLNVSDFSNESVSTDDVFWYFIPKADYDLDSTLPTASDIGYTDSIGWGLSTAQESGTSWTFNWVQGGSPQSPIAVDTQFVMVLGRVKSGISSAATNTLKPSDLDELAKLIVTETAAAPVLETLTASGSLTNAQIVGTTPDLTGLTFTAGYSDGSSTTVSSTAITVSPATYPADGNPDNLREVDLTLSYTDGDVTATTGVDNVVTHRPNAQTLSTASAGHVYFDYDPSWKNTIKDPMTIVASGAQAGDLVFLPFTKAAYDGGTTISVQDVMTAASAYSTDWQTSTPNTGINDSGETSSNWSIAWAVTGQDVSASTDGEFVFAIGEIASGQSITGTGDLSTSFSSSVLASDPVVYSVTITV